MTRKLNLGCGADYRDGYINVDTNTSHKADLYEDVTWLRSLADASCSMAVAQDVLEHLPRARASTALCEWNRVLKIGGELKLRLPSVVDLLKLISRSVSVNEHLQLLRCLYGTQGYNGDFHLNGFTELTLRQSLEEAGFLLTSLSIVDEWNFDAAATKVKHRPPDPMLRLPSDEAFVDSAYTVLLGRPADSKGKSYYLRLLQTGIARESIVEVLKTSAEYRTRLALESLRSAG